MTSEAIMPGFVSNPYKFMARSSLFVLSSDGEGLANVIIEALASATLKNLKGDKRIPTLDDLKEFNIKESTKQYLDLFNI